jgi:hypothetical protein
VPRDAAPVPPVDPSAEGRVSASLDDARRQHLITLAARFDVRRGSQKLARAMGQMGEWAVGSDGVTLVAYRASLFDDPLVNVQVEVFARRVVDIANALPPVHWDLPALQAWAGCVPMPERCGACSALGAIPCECAGRLEIVCTCAACGDKHSKVCDCNMGSRPCPHCSIDVDGMWAEISSALMFGAPFDRNRVADAIMRFAGGTVTVCMEEAAQVPLKAYFVSDDARAAVCGLNASAEVLEEARAGAPFPETPVVEDVVH